MELTEKTGNKPKLEQNILPEEEKKDLIPNAENQLKHAEKELENQRKLLLAWDQEIEKKRTEAERNKSTKNSQRPQTLSQEEKQEAAKKRAQSKEEAKKKRHNLNTSILEKEGLVKQKNAELRALKLMQQKIEKRDLIPNAENQLKHAEKELGHAEKELENQRKLLLAWDQEIEKKRAEAERNKSTKNSQRPQTLSQEEKQEAAKKRAQSKEEAKKKRQDLNKSIKEKESLVRLKGSMIRTLTKDLKLKQSKMCCGHREENFAANNASKLPKKNKITQANNDSQAQRESLACTPKPADRVSGTNLPHAKTSPETPGVNPGKVTTRKRIQVKLDQNKKYTEIFPLNKPTLFYGRSAEHTPPRKWSGGHPTPPKIHRLSKLKEQLENENREKRSADNLQTFLNNLPNPAIQQKTGVSNNARIFAHTFIIEAISSRIINLKEDDAEISAKLKQAYVNRFNHEELSKKWTTMHSYKEQSDTCLKAATSNKSVKTANPWLELAEINAKQAKQERQRLEGERDKKLVLKIINYYLRDKTPSEVVELAINLYRERPLICIPTISTGPRETLYEPTFATELAIQKLETAWLLEVARITETNIKKESTETQGQESLAAYNEAKKQRKLLEQRAKTLAAPKEHEARADLNRNLRILQQALFNVVYIIYQASQSKQTPAPQMLTTLFGGKSIPKNRDELIDASFRIT